MIRITGGTARGILLDSLEDKTLRPSTDYIRQAIFSSLGYCIQDASVLDVFAGTGSYGLEALSRGAKEATFLEKNPKLQPVLQANAAKVCKSAGLESKAYSIYLVDALKWLGPEQSFDIIFVDPPYALFEAPGLDKLFKALYSCLRQTEQARLVIEHPGHLKELPIEAFSCIKRLGKAKGHQPSASIYALV